MDIVQDGQFEISSVTINNMRPCSLGIPISPSTSSIFNSPTYTFTQSYGQPFKPGDQWLPYNKNLCRLYQRIETFKTWTSGIKLRPWDFAKSGFYYTGGGDAVTCFFCGTTVTIWQMAEDVNSEHKKHSPSCLYLKMIYDDDFHTDFPNLSLCPNNVLDTSSMWTFGSPFHESGWGPFNTSMVKYRIRINSFKRWPIQMKQCPIDLARSGFYYTEIGDILNCFHCGISLSKWESTDLPDNEHKKHSPNCKYLYMARSL